MINDLFGSATTEKVLLYINAMGEGYASKIAESFNISQTQTRRTLEKLENSDILVGLNKGRSRIYQLNNKWYLANELKQLLNKALLYIPLEEQNIYFAERKKPRKKNKRI